MDRFTVFCRTELGDRALADSKLLADKSQRKVLEVVDGFSTAGELGSRLGDAKAATKTLTALESAGFIETLDARMARVAEQESRWLRGDPATVRKEPTGMAPAADDQAVPDRAQQKRLRAAMASGSRASVFDRVRAFFSNVGHEVAVGKGRRSRALRRSVVGSVLVALVGGGVAAVAALGWHVSSLRVRVEREAALWLGEPVKVGSVGVGFHPWPAFDLGDVRIGEGGTSTVARAWGQPDWLRWATGQPQRLSITLERAVIQPGLLRRVAGLPAPGKTWRLARVHAVELAVPLGSVTVDGLAGEFAFSDTGEWSGARLSRATSEGTPLSVELEARAGRVMASVGLTELPYAGSKLESVLAQGEMTDTGLSAAQFGLNWLTGAFKGVVDLDFASGATLAAAGNLNAVSADALLGLGGFGGFMSGRVSGPVTVSGRSETLAGLMRSLQWRGSIAVADGTLGRLDLVEAMRRSGTAPVSGGVTRFARMEGVFTASSAAQATIDIRRIDSGALSASGRVTTDEKGELRGVLRGEVRTPLERIVRVFAVEGSLNAPRLRPQGE